MKKYFTLVLLFSFFVLETKSQNVGINTTGAVPNSSSLLDIDVSALATKKGLLIPRMTAAEKTAMNPLPAAAQGLIIYQTDGSQGFYYNISITTTPNWVYISAAAAGWLLTGNAGTTSGTNFVGTTDSIALAFKVNGHNSGRIGLLADNNTSFGNSAHSGATGTANTAFGARALSVNTTGNNNTAVGSTALSSNTTGGLNTAMGVQALFANTTGTNNTANGFSSLYFNTTGGYNTGYGVNTLNQNLSGNNNTALGYDALVNNLLGSNNTATGYFALGSNSSGSNNTSTGNNSMYSNTTGTYNTATGNMSLYNNLTGFQNTATGDSAMYNNLSGYKNTATGGYTLSLNTTGSNNTATGFNALSKSTTATDNTATGVQSLFNTTTGIRNVATGVNSMFTNTTGALNVATGYNSLYFNTTAAYGTANGYQAMYANTSGNGNTGIAYQTLYGNTTGSYNSAVGTSSMYTNTTGAQNTALGYLSLYGNTVSNFNTAIGTYTLYSNTTGASNVAVGYGAGYTAAVANANISGSFNVFIGSNAGPGTPTQLNNAIAIGKNALVSLSNAMVLGGTGADAVKVGIGTTSPAEALDVCGNGRITGTFNVGGVLSSATGIACSSDRRFKKNILPLEDALKNVLNLQGVTYNWRTDEFPQKQFDNKLQIGFIAQDIESVFPQMVFTDKDGYKSVDYSRLTPVLVEAIKELKKTIDSQNRSIEELKAEMKAFTIEKNSLNTISVQK